MEISRKTTLALLRCARDETLQQVAEHLGITAAALSYLERGQLTPSKELAAKLVDYFRLPLDILLSKPEIATSSNMEK